MGKKSSPFQNRTKNQAQQKQTINPYLWQAIGALTLLGLVLLTMTSGDPDCSSGQELVPFECDGTLFLIQKSPSVYYHVGSDGSLLEFGNATACPDGESDLHLNGQGFRPSDGLIYGIAKVNNNKVDLYRTGAEARTEFYATIEAPAGYTFTFYIGAIDENSIYYMAGKDPNRKTVIYTLDLNAVDQAIASGSSIPQPTPLALSQDYPSIHDWAFNPLNGKLYAIKQHTGAVVEMDLNQNPVQVSIHNDNGSSMGPFGAVYFGSDGTLYASQNDDGQYSNVFRINYDCPGENCGDRVLLGTSESVSLNDGTSCVATQPTLQARVEPQFATPGDTVTYFFTFVNPSISQIDVSDVVFELKDDLATASFVPGSLNTQANLQNINSYAGTQNLNIAQVSIPAKTGTETGKADFSVRVVLPPDRTLFGKTLPAQAAYRYGTRTLYSSDLYLPPGSPTPVQVVEPFAITKRIVQGDPIAGTRIQYEVTVTNPADGGNYDGAYRILYTDTLIYGGKVVVNETPEISSTNPNYVYNAITTTDSTVMIDGILMKSTDELTITYYVDIDPALPIGDMVVSQAQAEVPNTNIITEAEIETITFPVEYLFFEVEARGEGAYLFWATATEQNNKGFEVQYSADGSLFATLGWVDGHGNSQQMEEYEFVTPTLSNGRHFFRLKQIDLDGQFSFSPQVALNFMGAQQYGELTFGPNPFSDRGTVRLNLLQDADADVALFNIQGVQIRTLHSGQLRAGQDYSFELNGSSLAPGYYFIRVQGTEFQLSEKIVKR